MRIILFLCLLALFTCKFDFFETAKCIISKPKVQELGLKLFSYLYTKDYDKILPAILNSFSDLKTAIKDCLTDNDDDDVVLTTPQNCKDPKGYDICIKVCSKYLAKSRFVILFKLNCSIKFCDNKNL